MPTARWLPFRPNGKLGTFRFQGSWCLVYSNYCEADDVDAYRSIEPMPNGLYSLGWGYAHCDPGAMTMFGIWAEVWGGVTGHRCAWLKADGVIQQYQTREEAEAEATRLAREHNGNPHRTASFRYSARPLPTY